MNRIVGLIALSGAVLIGTQAAVAQDVDVEDEIADGLAIGKLFYNGSGCGSRDSLRATLVDSDHDGFAERLRFNFSDYEATQGPGVSIVNRSRNCAIRLTLDQPSGWQFGLVSVRLVGNAQVPGGVIASLQSQYSFPISDHGTLQSTVAGPYHAAYQRGDALDQHEVVWSPCGIKAPTLGLNTQISLTGNRTSPASVSSTRQVYWLQWQRCT